MEKNPDATISRRVWKKRPHSSICYSRWIIPGITVRWCYKLITRDKNGPWVNHRDTVYLTVKGNTTCEYPVEPYYLIKNEKFSINGNTLKANFDIEKITDGAKISTAFLLVNKTQFVDDVSSINRVNIQNISNLKDMQIEMDISNISDPVLYARIGIQITGLSDYLFSRIEKIR